MGQCRGRPRAGEQAVPGTGRVPGGEGAPVLAPGGAHLPGVPSSGLWCPPHRLGWAARTSATLPKVHGRPLCQAGLHLHCPEVPVLTCGLPLGSILSS